MLTFKATLIILLISCRGIVPLDDLVSAGTLIRFEPKLDPGELVERFVYMRKEAWEWCFSSAELGYPCPNPNSFDRIHATLTDFCTGTSLIQLREIRRFNPIKKDTWELKALPPDAARIFGWFYDRNIFIATHCALKKDIPRYRDYPPHIQKIQAERNMLGSFYKEGFDWNQDERHYTDIRRRSS